MIPQASGEIKIGEQEKELSLVSRIRSGDQPAFEEFVRLYQKRIFKFAYWFFSDREDAMEVVQETFLRIYKKIDRFNEDISFKSWVYKITSNICIDYYNKFKKKKLDAREFYRRELELISEPDKDPQINYYRKDMKERISLSVRTLSKRQKMVFILKHYNNLKFREISEVMKISTGTAKSLHFRAIQQIKKQTKPLSGELK